MKKKAFTLAEVLITLGIIGVVAALTMPSLIANYQKKQTVTQLKKAYSELYQAYTLSVANNGDSVDWIRTGTTPADDAQFLDTYIFPYLKTAKICKTDVTECGFSNKQSLNGSSTISMYNVTAGAAAVLADGATIYFNLGAGTYVVIWIDINGNKAPNTVGKDMFRFNFPISADSVISIKKFSPLCNSDEEMPIREILLNGGDANGTPGYACNKDGNGSYCACLIMLDGWEIAPDYPW